MTTYTITEKLLQRVMDAMNKGCVGSKNQAEYEVGFNRLKALQPNVQEPVAWMLASAMDDFKRGLFVEVSRNKEEVDDLPLYTNPTPQQPAELLATDEFYSWWGQNLSLEKQEALVQFYDKQQQPAELLELSDEEITQAARLGGLGRDSIAMFRAVLAAANAKRGASRQKPLTGEQIMYHEMWRSHAGHSFREKVQITRAIEAAHGIS